MLVSKFGDWNKLKKVLASASKDVQVAFKESLREEGEFLKTKMQEGIKDQAPGGKQFKPLSPETLAVRRLKNFSHDKALLKSTNLYRSINVFEEKNAIFIGVRRTRKDDGSVVDVASIHEYGSGPIVVEMTKKMRALLFAAFKKAGIARSFGKGPKGNGILISRIPARPFVRPVLEKYGKDANSRIQKKLAKLLKEAMS